MDDLLRLSRSPSGHSRSHSYQVTSNTGAGGSGMKGHGVRGRASDGALRGDIAGERKVELVRYTPRSLSSTVHRTEAEADYRAMHVL